MLVFTPPAKGDLYSWVFTMENIEKVHIGDHRFCIFANDTGVSKTIKDTGNYGFGELKVYDDILNDGDLFVDVGMNIGAISFFLKKRRPDVRIIGFEPIREYAQLAVQNLADFDAVEVFNFAVGADNKFLRAPNIALDRQFNFGATQIGNQDTGALIAQVSIDEFFAGSVARPRLLKIDTEGGEFEVIQGATSLFHSDLIISYEADRPSTIEKCMEFLKPYGVTQFAAVLAIVDRRGMGDDDPYFKFSTVHMFACFGAVPTWVERLGRKIDDFEAYQAFISPVLARQRHK